jgi:acyl transferase domain-containing protein/thioesterase domain-containing protein
VTNSSKSSDIAIVGMALRVPGARTLDQFWQNVRDGVVSLQGLTEEQMLAAGVHRSLLRRPNYVPWNGLVEDVECFDAGFFGIGPRDAAIMDPQHRHFLECAWEALEHAGHPPAGFTGAIGVYGGCGMNGYMLNNLLTNPSLVDSLGMFLVRHTANDKDFLTTGVSYRLNLGGPSISVQTACSTSLVAIHLAVQGLLNGECDLALAGGVTVQVPHAAGYLYEEGEILSPDGYCRPFDAAAGGTVMSSGAGVVVLRRLQDALADGDYVHAVIKGSAVNNDGSAKVSYLAPSVDGHAAVVAEALALAGVSADSIQYFEAHGTGTAVGDPIEVAAVSQAFRLSTQRRGYCRIGSTKANVGHLDTAAGVVSVIKTVEAMKHRTLPPLANFQTPHPNTNLDETPFYASAEAAPWTADGGPRRAGVSSLGVGGTNAHVILEESPAAVAIDSGRPWQLLLLSGKTEAAADSAVDNLAQHLRANPDLSLADVAYTLQAGRAAFEHRRAIAVGSVADAAEALAGRDAKRLRGGKAPDATAKVVFMFPGMGSQYPNMGRGLYESEPLYRDQMDECLRLMEGQLDIDLRRLLYPCDEEGEWAAEQLRQPRFLSPAIFATEYATAKLLMSWGIEPAAMTGHSLGEYTAACLAGVFPLADALRIVTERGKLMEKAAAGASLSVPLPEPELRELLDADLSLATVNAPALCVVSGTDEAIARLEAKLAARDVECRRLRLAAATHSHLLDAVLDEFRCTFDGVRFAPPFRPYIANLTGTWARPEDAQSADYWVRHLRQTVRFADGLSELLKDEDAVLLEVGPGTALATLARQQETKPRAAVSTLRAPNDDSLPDEAVLQDALGRLWLAGASLDWQLLHAPARRRRLPLPTYPFERQRHWIEPGQASARSDALTRIPDVKDWFYRPVWKRADLPGRADLAQKACWLIFLDESGIGAALTRRLRRLGHEVVTVKAGKRFDKDWPRTYTINPLGQGDYEFLVLDLIAWNRKPDRVVNLWPLDNGGPHRVTLDTVRQAQERCFFSLFYLAQVLGASDVEMPVHLAAVSTGMQRVANERLTSPEKALLLGPVRVIPRELPNVTCQSIDFATAEVGRNRPEVVESIIAELSRPPSEAIVAYRNGARWTLDYEAAPIASPPLAADALKEGGVYLITGGLGLLGLTLARHLAETYKARFILVGRTGLPPRAEWDDWIREHGGEDATSVKIGQLCEIEACGGEAAVEAADVSRPVDIERVVQAALRRFGRIDGVFHAAGVGDDHPLQLKSAEDVAAVLAPKVSGSVSLLDALSKARPAFVVLFSSITALLGPEGQVDYAAANSFLDALATSRSSAAGASPRVLALNWGVWAKTLTAAALSRREASPAGSYPTSAPSHEPSANGLRPAAEIGVPSAGGPTDGSSLDPRRHAEANVLVESRAPVAVQDTPALSAASLRAAPLPPLLALGETDGIEPQSGMEALRRALSGTLPQLAITSLDLKALDRFISRPSAEVSADIGGAVLWRDNAATYLAPRDEVETTLTEAFQSLLGIGRVSRRDDFFELGGHSLIALRLIKAVKQACGVELPLAKMLEAPTPERLASVIRAELGLPDPDGAASTGAASQESVPAEAAWASLVPIQPKGSRPPLFLVHGLGGNVLNFRDLARELGADQPFFGLQAFGLNGIDKPHESIEEMATHYLREIRGVQPEGPYYLGGFSGGGTVAFEMARQLKAEGEEVPLVIFLDTWGPQYLRRSSIKRVFGFFKGLRQEGSRFVKRWVRRKVRRVRWFLERLLIRLRLRTPVGAQTGPEPAGEEAQVELSPYFAAAELRYDLRPLDQRAVMLRAMWRGEEGYVPRDFGWTPYVSGGLPVLDVPGDHEGMFYEPFVRIMARHVRNELDKAFAAASSTHERD